MTTIFLLSLIVRILSLLNGLNTCLALSPTHITKRMNIWGINSPNTFLQQSNQDETEDGVLDSSKMNVRQIKDELNERCISYNDCFDKESLILKLIETRTVAKCDIPNSTPDYNQPSCKIDISGEDVEKKDNDQKDSSESSLMAFDRDAAFKEKRCLRVKELRSACGERNIRWANMFEKEDLVQALVSYEEKSFKFSPSGALTPGKVTDVNGDILEKEISKGLVTTPLLLDVYATWCGPCQMMAPQLVDAAKELRETVRVAKIDADKYPEWTSRLKVTSFPTVIVIDGKTANELQRVEGALTKDQLIQLMKSHIVSV